MQKPTSTQIGVVAENLVANALILESSGRFAPFAPLADDEGIDVLVYDKHSGRVLPLQVKARTITLKKRNTQERGNVVHFEVREIVLRRNKRTHLLAVLLNREATIIEASWLIPLSELEKVARKTATKYVVRASRSRDSSDKYHKYFCNSTADVVARLKRLFDVFDRRFPPIRHL